MPNRLIDTLSMARRLEAAGYTRQQAEGLVTVMAEVFQFPNGELFRVIEESPPPTPKSGKKTR